MAADIPDPILIALAAFGMAAMGVFDIGANVYWGTPWPPAASMVGGLFFGYGMSIARNCGHGAPGLAPAICAPSSSCW